MPNVTDLLGFAIDKNPTDFASAFDNLVREKAAAALEDKKTELANSIYGLADDESDDVDFEDTDFDLEDVDTDDDFDDEDLDIDLDDLDLDDLDVEDLDGDELDD